MANAAVSSSETWSFVPKDDRDLPIEQQSRFILRPLSLTERAAVRDNLTRAHARDGERVVVSRGRQVAIELVRSHLVSAENFPAGAPKTWPAPSATTERDAYLDLLGDALVNEIGNQIFDHSALLGVAEAAAKKS